MGNSGSKSTSLSKGFQYFDRLPLELQNEIWKIAANAWIHEHVDFVWFWTTPSGKRVFLVHLKVDMRRTGKSNDYREYSYVLRFPELFFVSLAARHTMYDALLGAGDKSHAPVARGEDVHLFMKLSGEQKPYITAPHLYGWRIQDFRYPDLQSRAQAEDERLKELREELVEVADKISRFREGTLEGEAAELITRSEGYVRLPMYGCHWATYRAMNGRVMHDLYPKMPKMQTRWIRRDWDLGVLGDDLLS